MVLKLPAGQLEGLPVLFTGVSPSVNAERVSSPTIAILPIATPTVWGIENTSSSHFTYKRENAKLPNHLSHFEEFP